MASAAFRYIYIYICLLTCVPGTKVLALLVRKYLLYWYESACLLIVEGGGFLYGIRSIQVCVSTCFTDSTVRAYSYKRTNTDSGGAAQIVALKETVRGNDFVNVYSGPNHSLGITAAGQVPSFLAILAFTSTNVHILTPACIRWASQRPDRHLVHLLYWYKCTNTDTHLLASCAVFHRYILGANKLQQTQFTCVPGNRPQFTGFTSTNVQMPTAACVLAQCILYADVC